MTKPDLIFVRPEEDRKVRKPDGSPLNPEGERVEADTYWSRRVADGDVTTKPLPKAKAETAKD